MHDWIFRNGGGAYIFSKIFQNFSDYDKIGPVWPIFHEYLKNRHKFDTQVSKFCEFFMAALNSRGISAIVIDCTNATNLRISVFTDSKA